LQIETSNEDGKNSFSLTLTFLHTHQIDYTNFTHDSNDAMSETQQPATQYRSYLLRLWPADVNSSTWRVALEEIGQAGERRHFPDLETLFDYLAALRRSDVTDISASNPAHEI